MINNSCSLIINNNSTDIVINSYNDRIFLIVSQYRKLGSFVSVTKESVFKEHNTDVYSTRVIFGKDEPEIHAASRFFAQEIKFDKPLLVSICLKDYEVSTLHQILVIGPPGSGKTTYCNEMGKFLESLGRKVAIINIDPANENMGYKPAIDVSELIKHEEVMKLYKLGPNGALVYCIEFLEKNIDWLIKKILNFKNCYILIDCPGQVELYTHHESMNKIAEKLGQNMVRLCSVHLMDSHHCSDPGKYLSSLMVCTITMLQLGLPHVNVMTKLDEMKRFSDKLDFNIDFYTEVLDLNYLLEKLNEDSILPQYKKLNETLISLVQDYSLVSFTPLDISNKALLLNVKNAVDKANGYIYGGNEPQDVQTLLACAVGAVSETERTASLDNYM